MSFGETGYGFYLTTNSSDPTYYINNISIVGDSNFDPNITFNIADYQGQSGHLGNGFANNDYTLGTALASDTTYYWSDVLHRDQFSTSIANGVYHFDAVFKGGTDAQAMGTLFDMPLTLEVVDGIDATVTESQDVQTIAPGDTVTVSSTVHNHMNRTLWTTTWYTTGLGSDTGSLDFNFVGDWFDKQIAAGDQRTDFNTTYTASAGTLPGLYTGETGVVGGLYDGDQFYFGGSGNTQVRVVPEPASLLALGGLLLFRRKR